MLLDKDLKKLSIDKLKSISAKHWEYTKKIDALVKFKEVFENE